MEVYVVGGAVRDVLLHRAPQDVDFVVVGSTPQEMLDLGYQQVGASFPVFLKNGQEYALARTERKTGVGYNGFECEFDPTVTITDDLCRRDLTMNSMAVRVDNWDDFVTSADCSLVIDPHFGLHDLTAARLRHTSTAFAEDPVRVLRTARFAARYGFTVDDSTLDLMTHIVHELDHVPMERIWAEFQKGLMEYRPADMIALLERCGAFNTKALKGYTPTIASAVLHHTPSDATLASRASWLLADTAYWNDKAYTKHCIPTEVSNVSKALNSNITSIAHFALLSPTAKVDVLTRMRAFNSTDLLDKVAAACKLSAAFEQGAAIAVQQAKWLNRTVDVQHVVNACDGDGQKIKSALRHARVEAFERLLSR